MSDTTPDQPADPDLTPTDPADPAGGQAAAAPSSRPAEPSPGARETPAGPTPAEPPAPPRGGQEPGGYPYPGQPQPGPGYPPAGYPQQGYPQAPYPPAGYSGYPEQKSRLIAGLLGIVLGGLGIHRFYLGYVGIGVAQIVVTVFTFGFGAVWGFVEGIMILVGAQPFVRDAKGVPLKE